jgi:DNA-binding CsgD family transcriptional regulator
MPERVVGREQERRTIAEFVGSARRTAAVLLLQGEAGIGKTTLWVEGVAAARESGIRVLAARPGEAEIGLAFAGLADLLEDVLDQVADQLPPPQRRALRVALLLEEVDGATPEERSVAAALVSVLRKLAEPDPLLIAIDDVQWLDPASARALAFAVRRLAPEPVAGLLAQRVAPGDGLPLGLARAPGDLTVERLHVGPLSLGELHQVLLRGTGTALPRPVLRRLHEVSGGNPFFAVEFAHALDDQGGWQPGDQLPVPTSVLELAQGRLATLAPRARALLPMLAAQPNATIGRLRAAGARDVDAGLAAAIRAGVVRRDGERLRFSHPLLASAAYADMSPEERCVMHRRLALAADEPEERGHHLAFASDAPDEVVAAQLDAAAAHALRRGAVPAAADFYAHARRLTPVPDRAAARRRTADEADCRLLLGENARAREILEDILPHCPPGKERAAILYELGRVEAWGVDWRRSVDLLQQALDEVGGEDDALRARAEVQMAMTCNLIGDDARAIRDHARNAAVLAERLGDDSMLAEALALQARGQALMGDANVEPVIERALSLEWATAELSPMDRPSDYVAIIRGWQDDFEPAVTTLRAAEAESVERGEETSVVWTLARIIPILCAAGAWREALADAERGYELAVVSEQPANQAVLLADLAFVEAHLGREARVREAAAAALIRAGPSGAIMARRLALAALGLLELSLGRPDAARRQLEPLIAEVRSAGIGEPGAMRFVTDNVEALIELGRLEDASSLLDWFEERALALDRRSALASAARCRGLLAAAAGDAGGALELLTAAAGRHANTCVPFESARTLLALGSAQLRLRRKRAARESLHDALEAFERLGAAVWAERAAAELARIGGRAPGSDGLTSSEWRVAELVGRGHTNREVAAALYLSGKTVESHLRSVYRKLGIRSRTELARRLAEEAVDHPHR